MIKRAKLLILAAAGVALLPAALSAQTSTWAIDPVHSSINFSIRHAAVSTVHGTLMGVKGTVTLDEKNFSRSSVEAVIDANTVNTNVDARDKDLKGPNFFDVANHPTLNFKSTKIISSGGKNQLVGDLTLGGVTRSITLDLDGPAPPQTGPRGKIVSGFSATGTLSRKDYNFGSKYTMPALGDEVKFTIDVEIDKQ